MSNKGSGLWWLGPGHLHVEMGTAEAPNQVIVGPDQEIPIECLKKMSNTEVKCRVDQGRIAKENPRSVPVIEMATHSPVKTHTGQKWGMDVKQLVGKTLPQLNTMIADHASKIGEGAPAPFETLEEAAAYLCQN